MNQLHRIRRSLIGDRAFYRTVLVIVMPIIIQNSVANFVNLLDNIMVGQLGTAQISAVAVVNQMIFVFNLGIFGAISGPGIFGAQHFGAGDLEGLRNTFRVKLWACAVILLAAFLLFLGAGDRLTALFLKGGGEAGLAEAISHWADRYLRLMLLGLPPFALARAYASTLQETGETVTPMKASLVSVLLNLAGNWLLIGGNLGFPALGVEGAAIATVFSRVAEAVILLAAVHRGQRHAFMRGVYRSLRVPAQQLRAIARRGLPLLVNEWLWALGMAFLNRIYSLRGLSVLAAMNISGVIFSVFNVVFISMGNAVAVIVGRLLGAGELAQARGDARRLIAFSFTLSVAIGLVMAAGSGLFPKLYNVSQEERAMAARFILVNALCMPLYSVSHASYFTLRSGGSTFITFLFDSVFNWVLVIPYALFLVHGTDLPMTVLYPLSQVTELVKSTLGLSLVHGGAWVRNIVSAPRKAEA